MTDKAKPKVKPRKKSASRKKPQRAKDWNTSVSADPVGDENELRIDLENKYGKACQFTASREGSTRLSKVNELFYSGLFVAMQPGLVYSIDEERTYFYDPKSGLWKVRSPEQTAVDIQRFMLSESQRMGFEELEIKRTMQQARIIHDGIKGIAGAEQVFDFKPDARRRVLHFKNGTIPIVDNVMGEFSGEFSPDYYSRNQIPIAYDPAATCPRFLNELLGPALPEETREEDIHLLSMCFGLFLLGVNLPQKIVILDGDAGSGKSTVAKMAGLLVGEANRAMLRTDHLSSRFELFAYIGKTLLMGSDVEPKFLLKPGANMLKSLVGGDMLQAEGKHTASLISIRGSFNALITANAALRVKIENDRAAWRRRLVIVRMQEHVPARRIESFENVLFREEGAGIVNWALRGLQAALSSIHKDGSFPMTEAQKERVEDLLSQSEAMESFAKEHLEAADGCQLTKREIRERFCDYCRENNWEIPAKNEIGRRLPIILKKLFGVGESNSLPENGKHVQGYYGVGWRDVTD